MASTTLLLVLGGCLLGAIQLLVGVAIGYWIRGSVAAAGRRERDDLQHAGAIARRLQTLAGEMSSSVGEYRQELEEASHLLSTDGKERDESIADLMVNVIDDIVLSNQSLQAKLDTAEGRLEEQAAEIEAHISRSLTDPLTGLPNRREFSERLEERMGAWNRRRELFSLMLFDVDHFKKLNDRHGHLAGDQVLASLGGTLRGAIRREDAIARYGGEEFAILLPNTSLEQATLVAQKVRDAVGRTVVNHNGQTIAVTMSGGIATIQANERVETLIQRADAALYAAKAAGRNCAFLHDGSQCRLADGSVSIQSLGPAAQLVELINTPGSEKPPVEPPATNQNTVDGTTGFGSFLPQEGISLTLAETCQELRRFFEQRAQPIEGSSSGPQV
jgi:diguanylate cyclase